MALSHDTVNNAWSGTSSDVKPTAAAGIGETFTETDTGKLYTFTGHGGNSGWSLVGSSNAPAGSVPYDVVRRRPLSVSAIGDSIVVRNQGNLDLNGSTAAQTYAWAYRPFSGSSFLALGAARSSYSWFPHEYILGQSGATSAQILSAVLPAYLANPFGLADAVVVLAGTNDVNAITPVATTIANLKQIYNALLSAGITPIAATVPPNATYPGPTQQLNWMIVRLAQEYRIPLADFYTAMVNPADGTFAQAAWQDGTSVHPSQAGYNIMGYVLNKAITGWWSPAASLMSATYDNVAITLQNRDPQFLSITGTHGAASSYPNVGWSAPSVATASFVYLPGDTELGTGKTMLQPAPISAGMSGGVASAAQYLGNSWTLIGSAAAQPSAQYNNIVPFNQGDKIAVSFRLKVIPSVTTYSMDFAVGVASMSNGQMLCGLTNNWGYLWANGCPQIGSEAGYPAGDFYFEYTVNSAPAGLRGYYALAAYGGRNSNVGDNATLANFRVVNLTQSGLLVP